MQGVRGSNPLSSTFVRASRYRVCMRNFRGKIQNQGVLAGHYKVGKTYSPPLMALDATVLADWYRDDLPDLLWPAALIGTEGEAGLGRFIGWQQQVATTLETQSVDLSAITLDGRLTSLEMVEESDRERIVSALAHVMMTTEVLPDPLLAVFRLYESLPGRWLLVDPWSQSKLNVTDEEALSFLSKAIVGCVSDRHKEAMLKFVGITWSVLTKKFSANSETIDLLKVYPRDPETVQRADSLIRASFNAMKGANYLQSPEIQNRHAGWSREFWRLNWQMTSCLLREELEIDQSLQGENGSRKSARLEVLDAVRQVTNEFNRFLDGFFKNRGIDLYVPDKHEVIVGLITRAVRSVIAYLRAPHLWCGEYGSGLTRLLAETEIVLAWLAKNGPDSYAQYQQFGIGKAKLMKANMANLASKFPDGPPEMLNNAIQHFENKLGGEWAEQFTSVRLDSNFADTPIRTMAQETGKEDLYRHVYQTASAVSHGEWWAVQDYDMQRCMNPLHRFHWVPSMEPVGGNEPELARYWITQTASLISMALQHFEESGQRIEDTDTDPHEEKSGTSD
jgi:hypothetical protein